MPTACYRFDILARKLSREPQADAATAVHTGLTTDRLFIKDGTAIRALGDGASPVSRWRSKVFTFAWPEGFGWAQVIGSLSTGVTLRLYLDGVLIHTTPPITSSVPVRLPAKKGYRAELEIESADRVVSMAVAKDSAELQ